MTRHRERYHLAARGGHLDLLREATSSECNASDENGMTPVMWAAFYGHLDALRVLMGRGADPDRSDYMGSTALHFAALNGHMNCVTYLVNFGANIWSLDTDFRSALDLAVLREHQEVADFLDGVAGRQSTQNKRTVAKLRERAALDAHRRAKKLEKKMRKSDKRLARGDDSIKSTTDDGLHPVAAGAGPVPVAATNPNYRHSLTWGGVGGSGGGGAAASSPPAVVLERTNDSARLFSDFVGTAATSASAAAAARRSPPSQRKFADVLYARNDGSATDGSASMAAEARALPGLLDRPGFGNVAFLHQPYQQQQPRPPSPRPPSPRPPSPSPLPSPSSLLPSPTRTLGAESVGTSASLVLQPWLDLPWTEPEVATLAPDYDTDGEAESGAEAPGLETFLAGLGLSEFFHLLATQRQNIDGLAACSEAELHNLGIPLGPRRQLLEALRRRREVLATRRSMQDLRL